MARHFLKEIGVTTKQFARIIQFNSALQKMTDTDYVYLTDIAYGSGFSEQSHFIRPLKGILVKLPKNTLNNYQFDGFVQFSLFYFLYIPINKDIL